MKISRENENRIQKRKAEVERRAPPTHARFVSPGRMDDFDFQIPEQKVLTTYEQRVDPKLLKSQQPNAAAGKDILLNPLAGIKKSDEKIPAEKAPKPKKAQGQQEKVADMICSFRNVQYEDRVENVKLKNKYKDLDFQIPFISKYLTLREIDEINFYYNDLSLGDLVI